MWCASGACALKLRLTALACLSPYDVNLPLHALGALTDFTVANIGFILLGLVIRPASPRLAAFSMLAGIISLAGLVLYIAPTHFGLPRGIAERITAYPQTIWFVVIGIALLTGRSFGTTRQRQ